MTTHEADGELHLVHRQAAEKPGVAQALEKCAGGEPRRQHGYRHSKLTIFG